MNGCGCFDPAVFGHILPCPLGVPGGMCTLTPPRTCRMCAERRRHRTRAMYADEAGEVPF